MGAAKRKSEEGYKQDDKVEGEYQEYSVTESCQQDWKEKIYKYAVRPAVLYGMETVAVTERMVKKMGAAELKMVRWALGVTLKDIDEERVHLADGEDQKNWGEAEGGETEMVRAYEEKGRKLHRQKNAENWNIRKEDKREAAEAME